MFEQRNLEKEVIKEKSLYLAKEERNEKTT